MSQIDPDDYQTEGSSALQDAANKAGKTATKKLAKKAVQSAALRRQQLRVQPSDFQSF